MNNKYELIKSNIKGLYKIKALRDFGDVKKGDIGGFVENEYNLSHEGDCWIYNNAKVFGNAKVFDDAKVFDNTLIFGDVRIHDNVQIYNDAQIYGNTRIVDNAQIYDNVEIYGFTRIHGNVKVFNSAKIYGNARIHNNVKIYNNSRIYDYAIINDDVKVYGFSVISGNAYIAGDVEINKGTHIGMIDENFKNILYVQCENRLITIYKDINNIIKCTIGCQSRMTLEDLLKRIKNDGGMTEHREEYVRIMENAHLLLGE